MPEQRLKAGNRQRADRSNTQEPYWFVCWCDALGDNRLTYGPFRAARASATDMEYIWRIWDIPQKGRSSYY